jgi:CRISPR-associated exonuclease Cas4
MYSESELIPLSTIQHYMFCSRRCALVHTEKMWSENKQTVLGSVFHEKAHSGETENRHGLRIARDLRIRSFKMGLIGKTDVVEFHLQEPNSPNGVIFDGIKGTWRVFPIEYKIGKIRIEDEYEQQLCAQAMCIEEMLSTSIYSGALYYGSSHKRKDVVFDEQLRDATKKTACNVHILLQSGITPPSLKNKRCYHCSMLDICMPDIANGFMNKYVENIYNSIENE